MISARTARALKENGGFFFTVWLERKVNRRSPVNEHGGLLIFFSFSESSKRLPSTVNINKFLLLKSKQLTGT